MNQNYGKSSFDYYVETFHSIVEISKWIYLLMLYTLLGAHSTLSQNALGVRTLRSMSAATVIGRLIETDSLDLPNCRYDPFFVFICWRYYDL